jgi:hypothetical protein
MSRDSVVATRRDTFAPQTFLHDIKESKRANYASDNAKNRFKDEIEIPRCYLALDS